MKINEFYRKYANLPFDKRFLVLKEGKVGIMTMHDIFVNINEIDCQIRSLKEKEKHLLEMAEQGFKQLEKEE